MINTNQQKKSKLLNWPIIIIAIIFLLPLGLFLGWKRTKLDQQNLNSGKTSKKVGIGFIIFYGLSLITYLGSIFTSEGFTTIILATVIFLLPGIYLFVLGQSLTSRNDLYREYIRMIDEVGVNSIRNIASSLNKTTAEVKGDLQNMINLRFLSNHFIDDENQLIINKNVLRTNAENNVVIEKIDVKCNSCGATNKIIKGVATECQYCHSLLQG